MEFRFVTGEYHATAWDQAVNSGGSEWPPSPWRILRALLATWHTRCPDLTASQVHAVVLQLSQSPPSYLLPAARPSHTRHYLPGVDHQSGATGLTSMTLAPRLQVHPQDPVVVWWPLVEIGQQHREVLAKLVRQTPYLGRAESRCEAILLSHGESAALDPADIRWTRPDDHGGDLRVLTPTQNVTVDQLEVTPTGMRKARRLAPVGARWAPYRAGLTEVASEFVGAAPLRRPTAFRWVIDSAAPFHARHGILATTGLRGAVLGALGGATALSGDPQAWLVAGPHRGSEGGDHQHAHWLWWADDRQTIRELALWVPAGIPEKWLGSIASVRNLPTFQEPPKGYRGGAALHLQCLGDLAHVLPLASTVGKRWRSRTPMLADRHPKEKWSVEDFVRREVKRELLYRGFTDKPAPLVRVDVTADWTSPRVAAYRRYRWKESMAARRRGYLVEFELDRAIRGPVSLGALSHFGFGWFDPVT